MNRACLAVGLAGLLTVWASPRGQSESAPQAASQLTTYTLDTNASGVIERINNIVNLTVASI
jgi:hypothetical protein